MRAEPRAGGPPQAYAAVVGVDDTGTIVHASDDIVAVLGWAPEDLVGEPLAILVPERLRAAHRTGFGRFVETGQLGLAGERLELPALGADGSEVAIELVLSVAAPGDDALVLGMLRVQPDAESPQSELVESLRRLLLDEPDMTSILADCLDLVGEAHDAEHAVIWVVDDVTDRIRARASWSADGSDRGAVAVEEVAPLVRGEGAVGEAWDEGRLRWSVEGCLHVDPSISGLHVIVPLRSERRTVGAIELVGGAQELSLDDEEVMRLLGLEIGQLLARRLRRDAEARERERLKLALQARRMGVWTYRAFANDLLWDERVEAMHGFSVGTFPSEFDAFIERVHDDDRDGFVALVVDAVGEGGRFDYRYRVRDGDDVRWIAGSGLPVKDADGNVAEIIGVSYDVTREVADREQLLDAARFEALAADVGRAFVGEADLDAKLKATAEAIVHHLDAAFARVWTLDDARGDTLCLRASAGMYTHLDGAHSRVPVGQLKIGLIAAERQPHLTTEVVGDDRVSDQEWAVRERMRSFAGYPLVVGQRCVGVLALFSREVLTSRTLDALGSIADTVAIGIEQAHARAEIAQLLEQERQQSEMLAAALEDRSRVATLLQQSLLPPSLPDMPGFEIAARYRAGIDEVGGDFYDAFPLAGGKWAFFIGDICGKGPEAARLTGVARHSLRMALMLDPSPAQSLQALNRALLRSDNDGRFCSVACGVVDASGPSTVVELGVAGHPRPIVVAGGELTEIDTTGPLLGLFSSAEYGAVEATLSEGDVLVVYTDGVIESRRDGELFGEERLRETVELSGKDDVQGGTAGGIADAIVRSVVDFDKSDNLDDLAVLAIRRTPS